MRKKTIERWTDLPGIGPWANYIAMRVLGEPDAFPAEDLVLRKVVGQGQAITTAQLHQRWRPWQAYATMVLWRHAADLA